MSRSIADQALLASLARLIEPLNRAMPGPTEVVLHDLGRLPNSILSIAGSITGRRIGGPATDMLLRAAVTKDYSTLVGYETRLPDGRRVRSTSIPVRGEDNEVIGMLCINIDVTMWEPLRDFVQVVLPGGEWPGKPAEQSPVEPNSENFEADIDALADRLLAEAIDAVGVPVELMKKHHKLSVVSRLKQQGFFLVREAADRCAVALEVTRYTIYNYLNELEGDAVETKGDER